MTETKRMILALLVVPAAIGLSACGGDDNESEPAPTAQTGTTQPAAPDQVPAPTEAPEPAAQQPGNAAAKVPDKPTGEGGTGTDLGTEPARPEKEPKPKPRPTRTPIESRDKNRPAPNPFEKQQKASEYYTEGYGG